MYAYLHHQPMYSPIQIGNILSFPEWRKCTACCCIVWSGASSQTVARCWSGSQLVQPGWSYCAPAGKGGKTHISNRVPGQQSLEQWHCSLQPPVTTTNLSPDKYLIFNCQPLSIKDVQ